MLHLFDNNVQNGHLRLLCLRCVSYIHTFVCVCARRPQSVFVRFRFVKHVTRKISPKLQRLEVIRTLLSGAVLDFSRRLISDGK